MAETTTPPLSADQLAEAESIRWRLGVDQGEYVTGWCMWRGIERMAIHFTSGQENGEVYIWRWIGKSSRNGKPVEYMGWWRTGPTTRPRFREGGHRHG